MTIQKTDKCLAFRMVFWLTCEIRTPLDTLGTGQVQYSDGHCI
jgi:hypothetical protein